MIKISLWLSSLALLFTLISQWAGASSAANVAPVLIARSSPTVQELQANQLAQATNGGGGSDAAVASDSFPLGATQPAVIASPALESGAMALSEPSRQASVQAGPLLNINFATPEWEKVGFAALGQTTNDVWNLSYSHGQTSAATIDLAWADGSNSGVGILVENGPGVWGNGTADPMYNIYIYPWAAGDVVCTLTNLPTGVYDFYLYGHGPSDDANSIFNLWSGGTDYGLRGTTIWGSGWASTAWEEGQQYAVYRNVAVLNELPVQLNVIPDGPGYAIINGMQVVPSAAVPRDPPLLEKVLNINFAAAGWDKTGFAAVGQTSNDVWNLSCSYNLPAAATTNLAWADGAPSTAGILVEHGQGLALNNTTDPMYRTYIYSSDGADTSITLTNLPAGTYDFYLYGHGPAVDGNGVFQLSSGGTNYGLKGTTIWGEVWNSLLWEESHQYVVFRNVPVSTNGPVLIQVMPGNSGFCVIAGMQVAVPLDRDGNGLGDAWELRFFGQTGAAPNADPDGDGLSNLQEYQQGTDPTDYYNGVLPTLTIIGGNNQTSMPGVFLALPLTVSVSGSNGMVLVNAPITFTASQGDAQLAATRNGALTNSLSLVSDANGQVSVFALMPSALDTDCSIAATAATRTNSVQVIFSAGTMQGVKLWLRADAGITNDGSGNISTWGDQTTNHNDAAQSVSTSRPSVTNNAANGLPAVHFDGSGRHFTLPAFLSGAAEGEVFVVLRAREDIASNNRGLWKIGNGAYAAHYPGTDGSLYDEFGSDVTRYGMGSPPTSVRNFSLYNVSSKTNDWTARFNGVTLFRSLVNAVRFTTTPLLGKSRWTSGQTTYEYGFDGDMAEVLMFARVLSDAEREQVGRYLNGRYAFMAAPPIPSSLVAQAVGSNQVSLSWSAADVNSWFALERKSGINGSYALVADMQSALAYLDSGLTTGTTYFYRVRAHNFAGDSAYSNEVQATPVAGTAEVPTGSELVLWLDAGVGHKGGAIATWQNRANPQQYATQPTASAQPQYVTNAINGRPVVRFDGINDYFTLPNLLSGAAEGEILVVLKAAADMPTQGKGLWRFGVTQYPEHYPWSDGLLYEDFGTTTRQTLGNPAQSLDEYHLFNVASRTNDWTAWINGATLSHATTNAVAFYSAPTLGASASSGWGPYYFAGDIAELMVFNRVLTQAERDSVWRYLNGKYAMVASPPPAPTALAAQALSPTQISLTWNSPLLADVSTAIKIERKAGLAGTYTLLARIQNTASYLDTSLTAGTQYYYRVQASNLAGDSPYSTEASATTTLNGADMPLADLRLWLKADCAVVRDPNNTVSMWSDQTPNHNNAWQTTYTSQPHWVADGMSGKPAVRFDGTSDYLKMPNILEGATQAEAFVVLRAAEVMPATSHALWTIGAHPWMSYYPDCDGSVADEFMCFKNPSGQQLGRPLQPLDQPHLYNVSSRLGEWIGRINGLPLFESTVNSFYLNGGPTLGSGGGDGGPFFAGDIAEVLIFDRVLTDAQRDAVGTYVNAKYALVATPSAPTNLTAQALSARQVSLTWRFSLDAVGTTFQIERAVGGTGNYVTVATVRNTLSYVDDSLLADTGYTYRVKAKNFAGESQYSGVASVTTKLNGEDMPLANAYLWLKADSGAVRQRSDGKVSFWFDQTTNHLDATASTSGAQPVWLTNSANSFPALRFDGLNNSLALPFGSMRNLQQAEVFVVLKAAADPPSASQGWWRLGGSGSGSVAYPNAAGNIVDDFGSDSTYVVANPVQSLDQYHLYSVSAGSDLTVRINGLSQYYKDKNQTKFWSDWPSIGGDTSPFFTGDIAELIIFNRVLTPAEREAAATYLNSKYVFVSTLPPVPTNLLVTAMSGNELNLSWSATNAHRCEIERRSGPLGDYALWANVWDTNLFVDATTVPETPYSYRVCAVNLFGKSQYAAVSPPTIAITNPAAGAVLQRASNYLVCASAAASQGTITQVQFYAEGALLGAAQAPPFSITWSNTTSSSSRFLSSKTWDSFGNTRISRSACYLFPWDFDGDGIDDLQEILAGTNPSVSNAPPVSPDPADTTPPVIFLQEPADAIPVP